MRATKDNDKEQKPANEPKDYAAAVRRIGDSVNDEMEEALAGGKTAHVVALVGAQIMGALHQIALARQEQGVSVEPGTNHVCETPPSRSTYTDSKGRTREPMKHELHWSCRLCALRNWTDMAVCWGCGQHTRPSDDDPNAIHRRDPGAAAGKAERDKAASEAEPAGEQKMRTHTDGRPPDYPVGSWACACGSQNKPAQVECCGCGNPKPEAVASSVLSWHDILVTLCRIYGNSKATDHVSIGHNVTDDEGRFVAQLRLTVGMLREWNGEETEAGHRKAVSRLEELDRSDRKQESAGGPLDVRIDPVLDLRRACNIALECFGDDKGPTARDALADIGDACDRYDKAAEPAGERAEGWHWRCGCLALYHLATLAECPVCHAKRPEAEIIEDGG